MDELEIRSAETRSGARALYLSGSLTPNTLFEFQDIVRQEQSRGLIIVVENVPYMDSAGLGAVLGAYASCQRHGQKFALAKVSQRVQTLLQVAKVDALVPRYDGTEAADTHVSANGAA
jgi:anti-sigma B factor antagonist